jgi:hypothetical protein
MPTPKRRWDSLSNDWAAHNNRDALEKENIRSSSPGGTCRRLKFGEQLGLANLQPGDDTGHQNKWNTRLFALRLKKDPSWEMHWTSWAYGYFDEPSKRWKWPSSEKS